MSNHDVGYGKPPQATKFRKGNRAWQNRKRPQPATEGELYRSLMSESVRIKHLSGVTYRSRAEIMIESFVAGALKGNIGDADMLLVIHRRGKAVGDLWPLVLVMDAEDRDA